MRHTLASILWTAASAVLLTACAGSPTQGLAHGDRQRIRTVAIASEVSVPAGVEFSDRRSALDAIWGPLSAAVGATPKADPRARIAIDGRSHGVRIEEIVRAELQRQLLRRGIFELADPADATIVLVVQSYGMAASPGYEDDFVPVLRVSATLLDAKQHVIWRSRGRIGSGDVAVRPVPLITLDRESSALKQFWQSAAEAVVEQILKEL